MGRWTNLNKIAYENRICISCNVLDDELHVLLECPMYIELYRGYTQIVPAETEYAYICAIIMYNTLLKFEKCLVSLLTLAPVQNKSYVTFECVLLLTINLNWREPGCNNLSSWYDIIMLSYNQTQLPNTYISM